MGVSYASLEAGTPVTWSSSGGSKVLNAASLAASAARQGGKSDSFVDGVKGLPEYIEFLLTVKFASVPANGGYLALRVGGSDSATAGTANPGGLTGADGTLASPTEILGLLDFVGDLPVSNALGTGSYSARFRYQPVCAHLSPVLYNGASQALSSTGTDIAITATPYYRKVSY